jgi:kynureninase
MPSHRAELAGSAESTKLQFKNDLEFARSLDKKDELAEFRKHYLIPKTKDGKEWIYMAGNSLGLQPVNVREYIGEELDDWAKHGVEGHWDARHPWLTKTLPKWRLD